MSLSDTLQDVLDDLEEPEDIVDTAPGPLPDPPRSSAAALLTSAESRCNSALASSELSSYAGKNENTYPSAANLPSITGHWTMLASDARDEEFNRLSS